MTGTDFSESTVYGPTVLNAEKPDYALKRRWSIERTGCQAHQVGSMRADMLRVDPSAALFDLDRLFDNVSASRAHASSHFL